MISWSYLKDEDGNRTPGRGSEVSLENHMKLSIVLVQNKVGKS